MNQAHETPPTSYALALKECDGVLQALGSYIAGLPDPITEDRWAACEKAMDLIADTRVRIGKLLNPGLRTFISHE